mgnify:CR=1 FL=1
MIDFISYLRQIHHKRTWQFTLPKNLSVTSKLTDDGLLLLIILEIWRKPNPCFAHFSSTKCQVSARCLWKLHSRWKHVANHRKFRRSHLNKIWLGYICFSLRLASNEAYFWTYVLWHISEISCKDTKHLSFQCRINKLSTFPPLKH